MTMGESAVDTDRSGGYSVAMLLEVLQDQGWIDEAQAKEIQVKEGSLRAQVLRDREKTWGKAKKGHLAQASSPEVVAAYGIQTDGGPLDEDRIMEAIAMAAGLPYYKIDPLKLDGRLIAETLSRPFARRHIILPLWKKKNRISVAIDNPNNMELLENIRALTNCDVDPVISSKADILKAIREVYGFRNSVESAESEFEPGIDLGNFEQLMHLRSAEEIEATDAHVVNAVDYVLRYAFEQHASDIHIEPKREETLIRMRIDGVLHTVHRVPRAIHPAMSSRIKSLARMDIAEKRRPQDGRIKTAHGERDVELRISTLPVAFGEKIVIRVFDPRVLLQDLEGLGFFKKELALFKSFIQRPHGIILVTGPTGSGKTTTLYSALRSLATPDINVVTIEDPIEMIVEEFNQVAVQKRTGITFSSALRTILRQDPDVIMVGEIRDAETANNAVQAALTGHLVFSTLHTNDSAGAVTRLSELGVQPFLISSTVIGVIAQRLVRKVCPDCKQKTQLTREQCVALQMRVPEGREAPDLNVWVGKGCVKCRQTGLRGRTALFEMMPIDERIRKLVADQADAAEMMKAAKIDGMMTLREAAIKKLAEGLTSFDEVIRVTADSK